MNNKNKISKISNINNNSSNNSNTNFTQILNNTNPYNPWEDKKNFVQDVGDISSFLIFLEENQIKSLEPQQDNFDNDKIINLLINLNELSKVYYENLNRLEILYEKYRNESILSKDRNFGLCDNIIYLTDILRKFDQNKLKIANLIHNTQFNENNILKIKHSHKLDLIKCLKIILNRINKESNVMEFINLSLNMHDGTINKLVK